MKEYLKMADVFGRAEVRVRKDAPSLIDYCGVLSANCLCPKTARHIAHAINSHDELVAMNQELLAALEAAVECGMVPTSSATEGGAMRYVKQAHVADQIRAAIAKAKGDAAHYPHS